MNQVRRIRQNLSGVSLLRAGHVGAERFGGLRMPGRIGGRREPEDGRRVEDHRDPVWDERVIARVTRRV
jgi:hypothetical protein